MANAPIHNFIDNYPENSRFLSNVNYYRGGRNDKGEWEQDKMCIIENIVTKNKEGRKVIKKKAIFDDEPMFKFYIDKDKDNLDNATQRMFVEENTVKEIICPYRDLGLYMAREAGYEGWYRENAKINKYATMKKMHERNYFHQTDQNMEDFIIGNYYDTIGNQLLQAPPLRKAFFDIEVDTNEIRDFPSNENPICPVNAISFYDNFSNKVLMFLLRYPNNPDFVEFEKNVVVHEQDAINGLQIEDNGKKIKPMVIVNPDGTERYIKDCKMYFFDNDEQLIREFFFLLNNYCKPDFLMAWNLNFDFNYLMARFEYLTNTSAKYLFCPDEWEFKYCEYHEDTKNTQWSLKGDYTRVAGWTQFVDQLIVYASLRATKDKMDSYQLDAVAEKELGFHKLDIGGSMHDFCHRNYERFVKYSMNDTFLLWRLENKLHDIDLMYQISVISRTRFSKAWKKTISLKNLAYKFFKDKGYIVSNNHNSDNVDGEKFPGAFVLEPFIEKVGMMLYGIKSDKLFEYACDFDFSSLYPSIMLLCMIEPANQYGKIKDVDSITRIDRAYDIMEKILARDNIKTGNSLFNLPSKNEILTFMKDVIKR